MIELEVEGNLYSGFKEIKATTSLDKLAGSFSFVSTRLPKIILPVKVDQIAKILVDGHQVIDGFIEKINVSNDSKTHKLTIEGRDKTCDIIDSTLGVNVEIVGSNIFENLIKNTLAKAEIPGINVINDVPDIEKLEKGDIESGKIGEGVFEFLERIAKRLKVFLITDGNGNIVITRSSGTLVPEILKNVVGASDSNILSGDITYDITNRYSKIGVHSQDNPTGLNLAGISQVPENATNKVGESIDIDPLTGNRVIRSSRTLHLVSESACANNSCKDRAIWETNIRRVRSTAYTCTVQGHKRNDTDIWKPGLIVPVRDDFSDINAQLLINEVTYIESADEGTLSDLTFIDKDAYQIQAQEPLKEKKGNDKGLNLF